jgi:hypothetical protein
VALGRLRQAAAALEMSFILEEMARAVLTAAVVGAPQALMATGVLGDI